MPSGQGKHHTSPSFFGWGSRLRQKASQLPKAGMNRARGAASRSASPQGLDRPGDRAVVHLVDVDPPPDAAGQGDREAAPEVLPEVA